MKPNYEMILTAWLKASDDLGIIVDPAYRLPANYDLANSYLLVRNFGSPIGTIILSIDDSSQQDTLRSLGYFCSALNFEIYSNYDRARFIDTLNDWGYFGKDQIVPDWYTGQSWTT